MSARLHLSIERLTGAHPFDTLTGCAMALRCSRWRLEQLRRRSACFPLPRACRIRVARPGRGASRRREQLYLPAEVQAFVADWEARREQRRDWRYEQWLDTGPACARPHQ